MTRRRNAHLYAILVTALGVGGCASPTTDADRSGVDRFLIEPSRDAVEAQAWRESGNEIMADYFERKIRDEQEARRPDGPVEAVIDILLE